MVYDAAAAGVCARTMKLVSRLKLESRGGIGLWAFHELQGDGAASGQAATAAGSADLVIFAAQAGDELPPRILKWIEGWLPLKKGEPAALALLQDPEPAPTGQALPACNLLLRMAQRAGLDFFYNTTDWPQKYFEDCALIRLAPAAVPAASVPLLPPNGSRTASPPRLQALDPSARRRIS